MINIKIFLASVALFGTFSISAHMSDQTNVCKLLKNKKNQFVYLLDQQNEISKGPINFGKYVFMNGKRSSDYDIPTGYKLIVASNVELDEPPESDVGGKLGLKKVKSPCQNSKAFSITIFNQYSHPVDYPIVINSADYRLPRIGLPDEYGNNISEIPFPFDLRVIGEIVDGTKK